MLNRVCDATLKKNFREVRPASISRFDWKRRPAECVCFKCMRRARRLLRLLQEAVGCARDPIVFFFFLSHFLRRCSTLHIHHVLHIVYNRAVPNKVSSHTVSCHFVWLYSRGNHFLWLQHNSKWCNQMSYKRTQWLDIEMLHVFLSYLLLYILSSTWYEETYIIFRESNCGVHYSLEV